MQLNPFLSVIYLMGKLFKLISQNICKKSSAVGLLSWHGNAMQCTVGEIRVFCPMGVMGVFI